MKTLYLNNSGSKWRNFYTCKEFGIGKPETIELTTASGKTINRTIIYWYSFGNFAYAKIKYLGKVISVNNETILQDKV